MVADNGTEPFVQTTHGAEVRRRFLQSAVRLSARLCRVARAYVRLGLEGLGGLEAGHGVASTSAAVRLLACHAPQADVPLIVKDTLADPRFRELAEGSDGAMRFLTSVAILEERGRSVGFLAVLDGEPRQDCRGCVDALSLAAEQIGVMHELTKQGDRAIASEHWLRSIIDVIPQPIFWQDLDGRFLGANRAFRRDVRRSNVVGLVDTDIPARASIAESLADSRARVIDSRKPMLNVVEERLDAEGAQVWLSISKVPLLNQHGQAGGMLGTYADISDLKRTEKALRDSEERFRNAVLAAPTSMLITDQSGVILLVNNQAERLFGYMRDELLGKSIEMLVPQRARSEHVGLRAEFFRDPVTRQMGAGRDVYAIRKDGTEFPVEVGLSLIDTGAGPAVLAAITDITLRRQAQEHVEAALKEKTLLLDEIHHRVKNNLQVISSLLSLQADSSRDEVVKAALTESRNRIAAMALTHELLYERKEHSRVNLGEYLRRLVENVFRSSMPDTAVPRIVIDAALPEAHLELQRAIPCGLLVNELLSNALQHAFPCNRDGRIHIRLEVESGRPRRLLIADDGVGLPPNIALGKSPSLGLQIVPLLADQARLAIVLQEGEGTAYRIDFMCPISGENR
ncbi:MAG: hypothetical protein NFCOHLIN_02258 [Gammaproteobacteria bacterium]|nr:hypothetical protein [Gammaproteobacteria bacterium]